MAALFGGLPRHAPGSDASTARAARIAKPLLPDRPRTLDLGCGVGRSARVLQSVLGARLVGLDLYRPFLEVAQRAGAPTVQADMAAPPFADNQFDLVWSEGAVYNVGLERALRVAGALLQQNGVIGFTELCRLDVEPPADAQRFWAREYPAVGDVMALRAVAEQVGYEILETFRLPLIDWEQEYYGPLRGRIAELASLAQEWEELRAMLSDMEREIRIFDRHGDSYGYIFCVARKL
jgi:SAM-dependent methyltransferase